MYSILSFRTAKYIVLNHKEKNVFEMKSDGSEHHAVNGGFNKLDTGANYRSEPRDISAPNFLLIQ